MRYASDRGQEVPFDNETIIARIQAAAQTFDNAYGELTRVLNQAAEAWAPVGRQPVVGLVLNCRTCGKTFVEHRDQRSPEYSYCTTDHYLAGQRKKA